MFTEEFLARLEYAVSNALEAPDNTEHRGYWCDGFYIPEHNFFRPGDPVIETRAWIGDNHRNQELYDCLLFPGEKSIAAGKAGNITPDCIPDASESSWVYLNPEEKIIHIQLL
jgi:hypothetical protein